MAGHFFSHCMSSYVRWGRYKLCLDSISPEVCKSCSFILYTLHRNCHTAAVITESTELTQEHVCFLTFHPSQVHHMYGFRLHSKRLPSSPSNVNCIQHMHLPSIESHFTSRLKSMLKSGMQTCLSSIFLRMFLMAWMDVS